MSRVKSDLSKLSLNQLSALTGKTYRTLKGLLEDVEPESDGATLLYTPSEVLPIIYGVRSAQGDGEGTTELLDPFQAKARLDKLKADKVQIEIDILKGKLIPAEKVETTWSKMAGAFRARILSMPAKLAPRLCATKAIKEIEKILEKECKEALAELSEYGDGDDRAEARAQDS